MWKLIQNTTGFHNGLRKGLLHSKPPLFRNYLIRPYKCSNPNVMKRSPKSILNVILQNAPKITFSLTLCGSSFLHIWCKSPVLCEAPKSRLSGYETKTSKHLRFDWKRFWKYLKPNIGYFLAAVFGALCVALLNIKIPEVMGSVVNLLAKFSQEKDTKIFTEEMKLPALKLIAMYVGQSLCTFFYIFMLSNLGEKIAYKMKSDLFTSILKQDIAFFDGQRTGEIINRLTTDIQDFKSSFKQTISGGLRALTQIIGCSISLVMISPYMTFVTLLCVPSVIAVGTLFGSLLRLTSRKAQAQIEKTTAVADEAVGNIRTVRAFAMEDQEREMFENEAETAMILNETLGFGIGMFQAGTNMFLNSMVLMTLYMGGYLLSTNQLSAGEVMAFLMSSQTIQRSLGQMSLLFGSVIRGVAAGSRVFEYINLEPTMNLRGGKTIPENALKGDIEFKNVTFAYPTRKQQIILKDFNLSVLSGKTVAIVGASGNGKSTVVSLIERFYDVNGGAVLIDGHDIRTLDPSWLRGKVLGFISQEPVLFGTTIIENIRYGKPEATDDEVRQAAQMANADEFISSFPKGYHTKVGERGVTLSGGQKQRVAIARALLKDPKILLLDEATRPHRSFPKGYHTKVGERGVTLSGGQKQRVAIARALLKDPKILLLDEATSALDAESEKAVQSALDQARKGRTVVVIAHRLSTIQNADVIVVLHKGKIVEMGSHDELKRLKGYYWALTYQQAEAA